MTRGKRIYVLDTNVLMHDPTALFKFEEHDVYLPMQVIEELDNGKKGTSEASRNARQVSRFLNELVQASGLDNLAERLDEDDRVELVVEPELDIVCVRAPGADAAHRLPGRPRRPGARTRAGPGPAGRLPGRAGLPGLPGADALPALRRSHPGRARPSPGNYCGCGTIRR